MPRLIWAPSSRQNLRRIDIYLFQQDATAVAPRMLRAIRRTADRLLVYPRLGQEIAEPIRAISVRGTPYLILYRLKAGDIEIVRVRHGRENWLAELEDDV